jgi:K+-transporting ATPase ATPase C chain
MKNHWMACTRITLVTILIFGGLYPLAITGIAIVLAPNQGRGKLALANKRVVGFALIGQKFARDRYFNGRPSAVNYNAAATGGSNKGPSNPEYLDQIQARIDSFLVHNPEVKRSEVPVDLVTASGSGLDPHISPAAAHVQIARIARVRHVDRARLEMLVNDYVEQSTFGLGPARVHVLNLNIALDNL